MMKLVKELNAHSAPHKQKNIYIKVVQLFLQQIVE